MHILDKYIIKQTLKGYFSILLAFAGLYLIVDLFSNLSGMLKSTPPLRMIMAYYFYSLPLIILRISPFAFLISTLYHFGKLNKNNEIVSMRASGISKLKMSFPVIFIALLISIAVFFIQEKLLMPSQKKMEDIKSSFIEEDLSKAHQEKNFGFVSEDSIYFVGVFLPKKEELKNVIIFKENRKNNITKRTICKKITFKDNKWIGHDVIQYKFSPKGNIKNKPSIWKEKIIPLKEKPYQLTYKKSMFLELRPLKYLWAKRNELKKRKAYETMADTTIKLNQKIVTPFLHIFLIIAALPLVLEIKKRKSVFFALGIGLLLLIIYYPLVAFSMALGKSGILIPALSVWLTPLVFMSVGITSFCLIR